jgi:hypothetical protein
LNPRIFAPSWLLPSGTPFAHTKNGAVSKYPIRRKEMSVNAGIWKRKRQELDHQRTLLLQQLQTAPESAGISSQLRVIEAAIAECTRNMEHGRSAIPETERENKHDGNR